MFFRVVERMYNKLENFITMLGIFAKVEKGLSEARTMTSSDVYRIITLSQPLVTRSACSHPTRRVGVKEDV